MYSLGTLGHDGELARFGARCRVQVEVTQTAAQLLFLDPSSLDDDLAPLLRRTVHAPLAAHQDMAPLLPPLYDGATEVPVDLYSTFLFEQGLPHHSHTHRLRSELAATHGDLHEALHTGHEHAHGHAHVRPNADAGQRIPRGLRLGWSRGPHQAQVVGRRKAL